MPARKRPAANNHLQEAMALLIRNQAAFVEQIARNDQERLALQRTGDERQLRIEEWQRKTEEWMRKSDGRFARIETELRELPRKIVQTILDQMPAIKKEIGFKTQKYISGNVVFEKGVDGKAGPGNFGGRSKTFAARRGYGNRRS